MGVGGESTPGPRPAPGGEPTAEGRPTSRARSLAQRLARLGVIAALLALTCLGLASAGYQLWGHYHFRKARHALRAYHFGDANRHLAHCLRLWPRDPQTLLLAAQAARRGDLPQRAEELLAAYRKHGGDTTDEQYTLEQMLLRAQEGDVDVVLKACQAMVDDHHPDTPRILEALARGYLRSYRVLTAQVTVQIWLDRHPDDPQAYFFSGWVKEHHDVPERAAEDYRRVLQLDPSRDDVRFRLAYCLLDAARPSAALELLDDLARRHPEHLTTRILRTRALLAAGRPDDALAAVEELLAEYPRYPPALTERGRLALQRRAADAIKWLQNAVALSPGDTQAWYLLAQALARQGKTRESESAMERFKLLQKDQQRMREIATKELSRRPHDAGLHHEVGLILLRGGERQEGVRWLKKALEKDPDHRPTHEALADYYQKVGQIGLASRHRQKANPPGEGGKK